MVRATHVGMRSFRITASAAVALLLAGLSLAGLLSPTYARETPAWAAQATGQDWFDLLVAAPWLALCGIGARRGSHRWSVLLAGAYAYVVYEMFIYAFAIHFNALFLVYCATLGIAGFALVAVTIDVSRCVPLVDARGAHIAGGFLVAVGAAFGLMWLTEDVPAMLRNAPSRSLAETGLFTNPVHVIDLAFVLPLHILAGVWLWQRHDAGMLLAPIVLAFGVLMSASIGGMMIAMHVTGAAAALPVTVAMFVVAATAAGVLARLLQSTRRRAIRAT